MSLVRGADRTIRWCNHPAVFAPGGSTDSQRRGPKLTAVAALACLAVRPCQAAQPAPPAQPPEYLIEEDRPLDLATVTAARMAPFTGPWGLGFTDQAVWIRFRVENPGALSVERLLTWEWPLVERLEVWVPDGAGGHRRYLGGLGVPMAERQIAHAGQRHVGNVRLEPGAGADVFARVVTRGPMLLEARAWVPAEMVRRGSANMLWVGIWCGALLALVSAALWSWRFQREQILLHYALFGATFGAYQLDMSGVLASAVPGLSAWAVWLEPVLGAAATAAGVLFTRRYLGLDREQRRMDQVLLGLAAVTGLAALPAAWGDVTLANQITSLTGGPAIGLALVATAVQAVRGGHAARAFFLAFAPFALVGGWYVATLRGLLPPSYVAQAAFQATFLLTGVSAAVALSVRRRADEARVREVLEAAVADRTRALDATVARLGAAQRLEAVGRLTAGVAHDFNNLLTAISADVGDLQREAAPGGPAAPVLGEIRELLRRGGELTRSLLMVARRQPLQPHPVDLNLLVGDLVRLLERLVKGVEMRLALDPAAGTVLADPGQLEQVVLNLVLNARDACDGRGRITLGTGRAWRAGGEGGRAGGEWVRLTVQDDGPGMDEATRVRVFEPFFTTKGEGKGTGVGLSVVDGVARAHGGYAEVASAPGQGATFTVWLPVGGAGPAEGERPLTPPPPGALTGGAHSVT